RRIEIREMMSEGERRADLRRQLRAVVGRTKQVDRRQRHVGRHRAYLVKRMALGETACLEQHQFLETLKEVVVLADALPPPQRVGGSGVGAGGAAKAEIDATGEKPLQQLEALGHDQRRV